METELRARAEELAQALYESWCEGARTIKGCFKPYPWEEFKVEEAKSGGSPTTEQFYQTAEALLQPTNPAYDSPDGWWLRLSGEQRLYLCKRYPETGVTDDGNPVAPGRRLRFEVYFPGEPGAGLHSFSDTIEVSVESGNVGDPDGDLASFMTDALKEWYDGAQVELSADFLTDTPRENAKDTCSSAPDSGADEHATVEPDDSWMADDCLGMIYDVLVKHIDMDGCPPMFYPEAIHNCIAMPKRAIMRAIGAEEKVVGAADEDKLVELIVTRMKEAEHFGAMGADADTPRENAELVAVVAEGVARQGERGLFKVRERFERHLEIAAKAGAHPTYPEWSPAAAHLHAEIEELLADTSPPQAGRDSEAMKALQEISDIVDIGIDLAVIIGGIQRIADRILATEGEGRDGERDWRILLRNFATDILCKTGTCEALNTEEKVYEEVDRFMRQWAILATEGDETNG